MNTTKTTKTTKTKATRPARAPRVPMDDKAVKALIMRLEGVSVHCMDTDMNNRLVGLIGALLMVRGEENHVDRWLSQAEREIRERHKIIRPGGCGCAVCRESK